MLRAASRSRRRAAIAVESAFVLPVVLFLILGLIIGGMGIFRYQEVAGMAREAARYAAVRGADYARETGNTAAAEADVYENAIKPRAAAMKLSRLDYKVTWSPSNAPLVVTTDPSNPVASTVTVTVTYTWVPELYLVGPITLSSTSTMTMAY